MTIENCITIAIDDVLAWDIPDEYIPEAIQAQAELLAGQLADNHI